MPAVSVIIPCYNQGHFLEETLASVTGQSFSDYEIIVVDDGSTDPATCKLLRELRYPRTSVIHTPNQGLAAARNVGIKAAVGKYILPLDSDDTIEPGYLQQGVAALDRDQELGIVYCKARLFGAVETEWQLPEYSLEQMLRDNLIFCSAFFRKSDWQEVGGYDPGMVYGWEDYDFWLSLIERGRKVYRIPEFLFNYRVASDSMVRSREKQQKVAMFKRIHQRHQKLFSEHAEVLIEELLDAREPYHTARLYLDFGDGLSDERSLARKVNPGTLTLTFRLDEARDRLGEGRGLTALRFDPADTPVVIRINRFSLVYGDGRVEHLTECADNSLLEIENRKYFAHEDAQCFLPFGPRELENLVSLSVSLDYLALGTEALRQIVQLQQQLAEKAELEKQQDRARSGLRCLLDGLKRREDESRLGYLKRQLGIGSSAGPG